MTIAENVTLLLIEDDGSRGAPSRTLEPAVGGALLLELLDAGALELEEEPRLLRRRVTPTGSAPVGDLLATALSTVGEGGRATEVVARLGHELTPTVLDRLAARGAAEHRSERVLKVVRHDRWVVVDTDARETVEQRLRAVLLEGEPATRQDVLTLVVLHEAGRGLVGGFDLSGRAKAAERMKDLSADVSGLQVVRDALRAAADGGGAAAAS